MRLRNLLFGIAALAVGAITLAPTQASARGWRGGWRGRGWGGPAIGLGLGLGLAAGYPYYGGYHARGRGCWRRVWVDTPYGPRARRVWVC